MSNRKSLSVLALLLAGLSWASTRPAAPGRVQIDVEPKKVRVEPGAQTAISATVKTDNKAAAGISVTFKADKGTFVPDGKRARTVDTGKDGETPAVGWKAPPAPGTYTIQVNVAVGNQLIIVRATKIQVGS